MALLQESSMPFPFVTQQQYTLFLNCMTIPVWLMEELHYIMIFLYKWSDSMQRYCTIHGKMIKPCGKIRGGEVSLQKLSPYSSPDWIERWAVLSGVWLWGSSETEAVAHADVCVSLWFSWSATEAGIGTLYSPGQSHRSFTHCWHVTCCVAKADGDLFFCFNPSVMN